jgi:hypothetical protein
MLGFTVNSRPHAQGRATSHGAGITPGEAMALTSIGSRTCPVTLAPPPVIFVGICGIAAATGCATEHSRRREASRRVSWSAASG